MSSVPRARQDPRLNSADEPKKRKLVDVALLVASIIFSPPRCLVWVGRSLKRSSPISTSNAWWNEEPARFALVKPEAAGGGGQRPGFTRAKPSRLSSPPADTGSGRGPSTRSEPARRARRQRLAVDGFTHAKQRRAIFSLLALDIGRLSAPRHDSFRVARNSDKP
jgi:hypothetical protein